MVNKLSVPKVINEGFNIYINNLIIILAPMALFAVPYNLYFAQMPALATTYGPERLSGYLSLGFVVSALFMAYIRCIIIRVISNHYSKTEVEVQSVVSVPAKMFLGVFILSLIVQLATTIGMILLVVPGVFVAFGWYVANVVYVNEESESIFSSISRSWNLTLGNKGQIFLINMLIALISIVLTLLIFAILEGGILNLSSFTDGSYTNFVSNPLFSILTSIIITPISTVLCTVVYFHLLKLKEGFDEIQMASGFMED